MKIENSVSEFSPINCDSVISDVELDVSQPVAEPRVSYTRKGRAVRAPMKLNL